MTLRVSLRDTRRTLARPAENARQRWAERDACIITLESNDGARGQGECAPLPGFSPDSLEHARRALAHFDPSGVPLDLEPGASALVELARVGLRIPAELPAARCALEAAVLDLWATRAEQPAWALLRGVAAGPPHSRDVSALLQGDLRGVLAQAELASAHGINTFKLKIGRPGLLEAELELVRELRCALGASACLRLDANRSLSVEQARAWLPRFVEHGLELVEEPCPRSAWPELSALGVPLALDESLLELDPASALHELDGVRAVILKPSVLGGVSGCTAWARWAEARGAQVVLSHAFEGSLGLALSATLALCFGSEQLAHGLDRESRLRPWPEPGFGLTEPLG